MLESFLWNIGKPCRPRPDATNAASDQGLHCLLTKCSMWEIPFGLNELSKITDSEYHLENKLAAFKKPPIV